MLADLQVIGTTKINNNHCVLVKDVKFARECEDVGLVGLWYGPDGKQHVSGLTLEEPESGDQAPSWTAVTNYIAKLVAQPDGPGKTSNAGGIYDFVNAVSNALYMIMQEGDAAARMYSVATMSNMVYNAVVTTGNTLVVESECASSAPALNGIGAAVTAQHWVRGEHVTASRNGEIVCVDLAMEPSAPETITVISGSAVIVGDQRQVVDSTWYRYTLQSHVPIAQGQAYEIRFPDYVYLTCVDNGFAAGYAIVAEGGDPGYDIQFRTLILEYTQEAATLFVQKSGDTMTGPLTVPTLAVTGPDDWKVGSEQPNDSVNIKLIGTNSKITTGDGKDLVLDSDGGNVVLKKKAVAEQGVQMNAPWAGKQSITSGSSIIIQVPGMKATDIVILTLESSAASVDYRYSVEPQSGCFTIYNNNNCHGKTFGYLVIRTP